MNVLYEICQCHSGSMDRNPNKVRKLNDVFKIVSKEISDKAGYKINIVPREYDINLIHMRSVPYTYESIAWRSASMSSKVPFELIQRTPELGWSHLDVLERMDNIVSSDIGSNSSHIVTVSDFIKKY